MVSAIDKEPHTRKVHRDNVESTPMNVNNSRLNYEHETMCNFRVSEGVV